MVLFALWGCAKIEDEKLPENLYTCTIQVSDTNIITSISESHDSLVITLESGERIVRLKKCFPEYQVDTASWMLNLVDEEGFIQALPFRGHTIEIEEDSILLDPYGLAPLTALVKFSIPVPGRIKIRIHGRTENSPDITHVFNAYKTNHAIPIYGLYADFENTVSIIVLDNYGNERNSEVIRLQTGPLFRIESGSMRVGTNNYTGEEKSKLFSIQNAIYDTEGYVRWYSLYRGNKYFPLANGLTAIQLWGDKGDIAPAEEDIRIINRFGQTVQLFDVPNRNHHEINEKRPGGNLLVATNAQPYFSTADDTEDMIVEIDRQTGEVVREWDLRDIFDKSRQRLWTEMPNDWCHLNSIEYDSADNTLLISSKLQYFVSKIDYDTGKIKWICGNHENWKEPWQMFLLTPINFDTDVHPDRDWIYAQHMPRLTRDGKVIVYDNGRSRPGGSFARAVEFRVDTINMTIEKTWTYDFNYSTRTMGSVQVLNNDNVLIGHGETGEIVEVTREGKVLFAGKLKMFYRAYPIQLY